MKDIKPISGYGLVLDIDVEKTLDGLLKGQRYAAADIYDRYAEVAKEAGHQPGHPIALGQTLRRAGCWKVKMNVGGGGKGGSGKGRQVSAWII